MSNLFAAHLREWAQQLSTPNRIPDNAVDTTSVLRRLAAADPTEELLNLGDVAALSRKIDIAKVVWQAYEPGWGRPVVRTPISTQNYAVLVGVLLTYSRSAGAETGSRDLALIWLNSAFNALDCYCKSADAGYNTILYQEAEVQAAALLAI